MVGRLESNGKLNSRSDYVKVEVGVELGNITTLGKILTLLQMIIYDKADNIS